MMREVRVAPSILAADVARLGEQVREAAERTRALRPSYAWEPISERTLALLESVAARPW